MLGVQSTFDSRHSTGGVPWQTQVHRINTGSLSAGSAYDSTEGTRMEVFADTFVPTEVGEWWFRSQPCPGCDNHTLHPVANLSPPRWLCSTCGRCWTPLHGGLTRVDPWTCSGCATGDRHECIIRLQRDTPQSENHSPPTSEEREERDRSSLGHWELLARVAQAQSLVCVQADCTADEASALMEERARATDERVIDVAEKVLGHRIWFD